jgi:hypothetical protein
MSCVIGIDFDNTIVSYDALLYTIAIEQHLIDTPIHPGKKAIRDMIRLLPDGEIRWQQVQSLLYGPRIDGAVLITGVWTFIKQCRTLRWPVYIISHKGEYAHFGDPKPNLREAAMGWMEQERFFAEDGLGLSKAQVYFGSTRSEKIERIKELGCTHFIDDLEEIFLEPDFPKTVAKLLYAPQRDGRAPHDGLRVFATWQQLTDYFFAVPS